MREIVNGSDVRFVKFHWAHPMNVKLRHHSSQCFKQIPNFVDVLKMYSNEPHAWTAMYRGRMACFFGICSLWPGVGEAWMLTTSVVEGHAVKMLRGAMRYFDIAMSDLKLHRLQITVNVNDGLAIRYANALKFRREGLLIGYGPNGNDHEMLARYADVDVKGAKTASARSETG
jgi:hypothetical protein